jgi:hypothetical protein
MSAELPTSVVAAIAFIGRSGGPIKLLSGFRKPPHTVPDAANAATNAFLAKICTAELSEQAESLFQQARTALGYKRKDLSLSIASPVASLVAKDFALELAYAVEAENPAHYRTTLTLRELRDLELARTEAFAGVFAGRFTELEFSFVRGAQVEAIIDAIEERGPANGLSVTYPSDCHHCTITVAGVDAEVRCTAEALQVRFRRAGSPAQLIDGFAAVRSSFQFNDDLFALFVV